MPTITGANGANGSTPADEPPLDRDGGAGGDGEAVALILDEMQRDLDSDWHFIAQGGAGGGGGNGNTRGSGGAGGDGGDASVVITDSDFLWTNWGSGRTLRVEATAGGGGWGGNGGSNHNYLHGGTSGAPGSGGLAGWAGDAFVSLTGSNISNGGTGSLHIQLSAFGGGGGTGGVGGPNGLVGGYGGAGGGSTEGGDAAVTFSGNTLLDPLGMSITAQGGRGGGAGSGGWAANERYGTTQPARDGGDASVTISANTVQGTGAGETPDWRFHIRGGDAGGAGAGWGSSTATVTGNQFDMGAGNDIVSLIFDMTPGGIINVEGNTIDGGDGFDLLAVNSYRYINATSPSEIGIRFDGLANSLISIERINGSEQTDWIRGTNGDEIIGGGFGSDTLDGAGGVDTVAFDHGSAYFSEGGMTISLAEGAAVGASGTRTITNFENVIATGWADDIEGDDGTNVLVGMSGGDLIHGGGGSDIIWGDDPYGNSNTGDDHLFGDAGDDFISGGGGTDIIDGGEGVDTYVAREREGGYTSGRVTVRLADGTAETRSPWDVSSTVTLISIENAQGGDADDDLQGDDQANRLEGMASNDILAGLGGDDVLEGGAGADQMNGGEGFDTLSYAGSDTRVVVRLATQAASGGHADGDIIAGFENVLGSAFGDTLIGAGEANRLEGGAGKDFLGGLDGDDVLLGGLGADRMDGGAGTDAADYSGSYAGVKVRLNLGLGEAGEAAGDTLTGIENLVGSRWNDLLIGEAGANRLAGGVGDDRLYGLDGDDLIEGGSGADLMDGGAGVDTLSYASATKRVEARLDGGAMARGDATGDVAANFENLVGGSANDRLTGSAGANVIEGGAGGDAIEGLDGDDALLGGAGDDYVIGGTGADTLEGGEGVDTLSYAASADGVAVRLGLGAGAGGEAEGDVLSGFENLVGSGRRDTLIGSDGANRIEGGRGNDFLGGLGGDDVLEGGGADDRLTGGAGADLFVFAGASGHDLINDFSGAQGDRIRLDAALFADFAEAMAHASDTAGGVVIAKGAVSVTLTGVTKAQLQSGWFDFAAAGAPAAQPPGGPPALPGRADDGRGGAWIGEDDTAPAWSDARLADDAPLALLSGPLPAVAAHDARDLAWAVRQAPAEWDWVA